MLVSTVSSHNTNTDGMSYNLMLAVVKDGLRH